MRQSNAPLSQRDAATWLAGVALFLAAAAAAGVAAVAVLPIHVEAGANAAVARRVPAMPPSPDDVQPLMVKAAGRRLIVPAQGLAAVKDTGAAQKLIDRLKLQGVVQLDGTYVAYVAVKSGTAESKAGGGGSLTVRKGDRILSLTVEAVVPGKVTLSLDGVVVELRQ